MNKLLESMKTAQLNGIDNPKIRLPGLVLTLAKPTSSNPDYIYIKTPYIDNHSHYLGKISPEGTLHLVSSPAETDYTSLLEEALNSPLTATRAFGLRTGICSCCGRTLTNPLSVSLGIGPVCRGYYGWEEPEEIELEVLEATDPLGVLTTTTLEPVFNVYDQFGCEVTDCNLDETNAMEHLQMYPLHKVTIVMEEVTSNE